VNVNTCRIEREKRWYKNRIQKLSKRGELEEALDLFDDMLSSNLYPDVVVYNNLIAGLGRRGDMKKAFKLFNDMKKRALLPTDHTYTSLFNCCSVAGKRSLRYLQLVREEMERREVLPNSLTANAIIKAYAMCGEPTKAYEVYVKMSNWNCSPDLRTFSFLLMACAEDKDGGVAKCLHVWPEISANGFQPDVYSFNLLLRCLRDGGIPKDMLGLVEADDTVNLDLHTNSTDLKAPHCVDLSFGRGNSLKMVVSGNGRRFLPESSIVILLSLMSKHSATPNIKTFNLLLGLLFDIPSSENHFLWGLMKKHGIDIDVQLINEVVECHAMKGCIDKAENALSLMSKWDITANRDTYRAYGKGCAKEKDGIRLQEIMKSSGFSLDEEIFETVLRAAARQRQFSHMTALLKRMKELAVLPNAGTKSILAEIVERNSKDNLSGYVLKQFNGFKGYFNLWKSSMWIDDDGENPEIEE
jgi:pentatricopeptide repeat domain-containing protein 1